MEVEITTIANSKITEISSKLSTIAGNDELDTTDSLIDDKLDMGAGESVDLPEKENILQLLPFSYNTKLRKFSKGYKKM